MIYLNQAGTSWPKPATVREAAAEALSAPSDTWSDRFREGHARVARGLGIDDPKRLLLTPGCTSALSVAITDHAWQPGDRIVTSALEHHAVARPAELLTHRGVELHRVRRCHDGPFDLDALRKVLKGGRVRLVALTAACNVTGELLPIHDIAALAHEHGALCLVDGAQICGYLPVDLSSWDVDLFTFAGHKGLHAPWGIGGLYVAEHVTMNSPAAACEVTPGELAPCSPMPGYCDVGSVDLSALAGLVAGMDWLESQGQATLLEAARAHIERMTQALEARADVQLHGVRDGAKRLPTLAFTAKGRRSADLAEALRDRGLHVASGLQCAPQAHDALGTAPDGVVRISVGPAITPQDTDQVVRVLATL